MPFLGTTPTQGFVSSFPKQSFTPNGSTTVFTLTNPVATANDLEVFVGNVRQEPTTAYTAAGTTLTMSEAPASGLNFYVINKSFAQVTTTPPVNSISTDKIVNNAVTVGKLATSGTLPALNGSALTGINSITSADVWEMSTSFAPGGSAYVTANWSRSNDAGIGFIGTGMSESSGVFTFPSTGIWEVTADAMMAHNGNDGHVAISIYATTDNSSYTQTGIKAQAGNRVASDPQMSAFTKQFIDVTNTSNVKIKYYIESANPCTIPKIQAMFTRLGDT